MAEINLKVKELFQIILIKTENTHIIVVTTEATHFGRCFVVGLPYITENAYIELHGMSHGLSYGIYFKCTYDTSLIVIIVGTLDNKGFGSIVC